MSLDREMCPVRQHFFLPEMSLGTFRVETLVAAYNPPQDLINIQNEPGARIEDLGRKTTSTLEDVG